ncbi:Glycoprotein 3-alpha-L-fucosyltransferase A [Holothuria leucospilota]|uniref:Fucosyltransferase n=1 Tax=Holothuria leucospilota TaxID=206669 RepID=A0A9Q1BVY0_HOLLE|nr:Glycoprotein 3-alpha-L-fucosyltransferase A [Holothuria leucospilota]
MEMNIRFNLSVTYHPKADISVPYGQFLPSRNKQVGDIYSNFNKKTKLIVWVASNCVTKMWRRSDFAYDLATYLPMDIYGACGTLKCTKDLKRQCKKLFGSYKFYLAMENSCCGGYITEKFWDALTYLEAIPVVVRAPRADYEKLAPNNSFIHADNFGSMKELAKYILKVSNTKALYDSYFQWKRLGKAEQYPLKTAVAFSDHGICRLTEYVKSSNAASLAAQSFDPYGPNWLGGCFECGEQEWLKNYSNFKEMLMIKKQRQNDRILKWSIKL